MNPCVVDSSVAFKWYRQPGEEDHVNEATTLLENHLRGKLEIHIPDLLIYELGNILRFKEGLASESAASIMRKTFSLQLEIHPINLACAEKALLIAEKCGITFYDASFLALSDILDCPFITADKKLHARIESFPNRKFIGNL
jgi:predicted nucleic acid-binding protein